MLIENFKTILTIFAHPDDETLAAGATIAKLSRLGSTVHIAIPATGIHSRRNTISQDHREKDLSELRKDCQNACEKLGVKSNHIYLGEFLDNEMDTTSLLSVIHWIEDIISNVHPDIIFTHHRFCTNIDHRYCHEACVVATRPSINKHISVISGEVPSSTGYLKPVQWEPNLYFEISEGDLEAKINAMEKYRGEIRPDPHPRSREVIRALAKIRGSEAGYLFAEAFMIQRTFG